MSRWAAVLLGLITTLLWSTSYILNKWAFALGIGPMTLAGLRYSLAVSVLAIVRWARLRGYGARATKRPKRGGFSARPGLSPLHYIALGLAGYFVAQGFQYIGQYYVTPTQTGMVLSVGNSMLVIIIGALWLREYPGRWQATGLALALAGAAAYYYPWNFGEATILGVSMLLLSGVGYAAQLTANRMILRHRLAEPFDLVLYPMLVGAASMLLAGLWLEPWPGLTWRLVSLLLWLGPVNGAGAFLLWTTSQRALLAYESAAINNTMLLQIAALDVLFLHRVFDVRALVALGTVGAGVLLVQLACRRPAVEVPTRSESV